MHHSVRFALDLGDALFVGERVPVVEVLATGEERRVIGHLGPDLCSPAWDDAAAATAAGRLRQRPDRPVVEALLDQRNLAGIGNLYAVEGCFLSGLYPWTPIGAVADLPGLVEREHRLLAAGVATGVQVTTGDPRRGRTHWVYGRYRRPCRRCATPIAFRPADGSGTARETWWCPSCQPAPAPGGP